MPRQAAGRRDTRVSFQRDGAGRSALGGRASASWADLFTRLAGVTWGSGAERRGVAVADIAVKAATFRVLADSDTRTVQVTDRIVITAGGHMLEGKAFDITDVSPIGSPVPYEIEFTATAKVG